MMNCVKKTCLHNENNMCGRMDDLLIGPDGKCSIYRPKYSNELIQMEGDITSKIAQSINRFKSVSGFSVSDMRLAIEMTPINNAGEGPETIVGQVEIHTEILEG